MEFFYHSPFRDCLARAHRVSEGRARLDRVSFSWRTSDAVARTGRLTPPATDDDGRFSRLGDYRARAHGIVATNEKSFHGTSRIRGDGYVASP